MANYLPKVKREIENKTCHEHGRKAEICISGNDMKFTACCEKFKSEMLEAYKKAVAKAIKDDIKEMFKGR